MPVEGSIPLKFRGSKSVSNTSFCYRPDVAVLGREEKLRQSTLAIHWAANLATR
jgi:hypothetical protein